MHSISEPFFPPGLPTSGTAMATATATAAGGDSRRLEGRERSRPTLYHYDGDIANVGAPLVLAGFARSGRLIKVSRGILHVRRSNGVPPKERRLFSVREKDEREVVGCLSTTLNEPLAMDRIARRARPEDAPTYGSADNFPLVSDSCRDLEQRGAGFPRPNETSKSLGGGGGLNA
ncbi:hypothetical protein LZ30DRAFT_303531 [Colletotrichum cereale]|nr:hypothetical protein LZ30DRAFT_303531 [Colletotrichum cereale]